MATATHTVSLDTYLHTAYRPDCDWVEGELRERHVGQFEHSNFQAELIAFFRNRRDAWKVRALPEKRIQVAATRFRVPDIVVILLDDERPPVLSVDLHRDHVSG
jgi:hypothetical protein